MTWFKVDDSFHSHPKVLAADPAALGLWVIAGTWCSANLTDGFVPDYVLPRLLPDSARLADTLVTVGLWRRAKGGYRFHDWHEYNPTAESVQDERKAARERMRKMREKRKTSQGTAGRTGNGSPEQHPNVRENFDATQAERSGEVRLPRPDPTRSSSKEELPQETSSPSGTRKRATRIPDDFAVTDEMKAWFAEHCPGVNGQQETAKFLDYWTAKSGRDATKTDWIATWRLWMRRAAEGGTGRTRPPGVASGANRHVDSLTPEQRRERNPLLGAVRASDFLTNGTAR
ncbi:hypothetical protein ACIA8K_06930 [Catenuloplanes sp. NPDC051500]|uniref:hypothetical protein n=1 Tax=Catenuloplanes sp. NPDC051500 TaxID=3363959 RepID=UPI00378729EC